MTRTDFETLLRDYLTERKPNLDASRLTGDANLWELGYIDSLSTVELILFVERAIARDIAIDSDVRTFGSIASIYEHHVKAVDPHAMGGC